MARPIKYKPEYVEQAHALCLLGATDVQLSQTFDVSEKTLNTWKKDYPEFFQSIREAKTLSDSKVVQSLYQQALDGNVTAQIFWLKNRQKNSWRDKHEVSHGGTINHEHSHESVPNTAAWITGLLGEGQAGPAKKPVPDRPLLPAKVCAKSS